MVYYFYPGFWPLSKESMQALNHYLKSQSMHSATLSTADAGIRRLSQDSMQAIGWLSQDSMQALNHFSTRAAMQSINLFLSNKRGLFDM